MELIQQDRRILSGKFERRGVLARKLGPCKAVPSIQLNLFDQGFTLSKTSRIRTRESDLKIPNYLVLLNKIVEILSISLSN